MKVEVYKIDYEIPGQEGQFHANVAGFNFRECVQQLQTIVGRGIRVTSQGRQCELHSCSKPFINYIAEKYAPKKTRKPRRRAKTVVADTSANTVDTSADMKIPK
jgi:hypothetical protein